MKHISKTVWVLSLVSLFTDTASEMLYPIMPIYLQSIGFSIVLIGVLEGFAEATAGLSKGYFGKYSDVSGKRMLFVQVGYGLSAISKPMMAIFIYPAWVFFSRTIDRFGKGIRTGARDAILSDEATPETKGKVFGFHRSMDTFGAVLGPVLALVYLHFYPENYKTLFFLAFFPGLLAVLASFILKDKNKAPNPNITKPRLFSFLGYWKTSSVGYKKVVIGLLAFTLFNSSDVFLLLQAKQIGLDDTQVIGMYIFYNLVYALVAFPLGILADKIGLKSMLCTGILVFSLVYLGMGFAVTWLHVMILFMFYGIYAASTEGVAKAWISNLSDKKDTATAIGTFAGFQSIFTMLASSLAGLIWYQFGAVVMFAVSAFAAFGVFIYFVLLKERAA
jgi:MFS family permease